MEDKIVDSVEYLMREAIKADSQSEAIDYIKVYADRIVKYIESKLAAIESQPESNEGAEDLKQYVTNLLYAAKEWGGYGFNGWVESEIKNISEFYAAQFKSQSFQLSDEEIEDEAEEYSIKTFSNFNSVQEDIEKTFIDAIKWYRDMMNNHLNQNQ